MLEVCLSKDLLKINSVEEDDDFGDGTESGIT